MTTYWKFYYRVSPSHTHVRVFSGSAGLYGTFGKNGDIIFRNEEWQDFRAQFGENQALYIEEEKTLPEKTALASGLGPHQKMRRFMEDR